MKKCEVCGYPLTEEEECARICERCFILRLKELVPNMKLLRKDGTETNEPDEAEYLGGIKLKDKGAMRRLSREGGEKQ
jgi:hypothetical protein